MYLHHVDASCIASVIPKFAPDLIDAIIIIILSCVTN